MDRIWHKMVEYLSKFWQGWSWLHKISLILVAIILGVGLGYIADIHRLQSAEKKQKQVDRNWQLLLEQIKKLDGVEYEIKEQVIRYKNFNEFSMLLRVIADIADRWHVKVGMLKPDASRCDSNFCIYPINLTLIGDYDQLLKFIFDMFSQRYLIVVPELNIEVQKNSGDENEFFAPQQKILNITLQFYSNNFAWKQMLSPYQIRAGKHEINSAFGAKKNGRSLVPSITVKQQASDEITFRDLFARQDSAQQSSDLTLWDIADLKLVGCIKSAAGVLGVIEDGGGNVYTVKVGMVIGNKNARVSSVSCDEIILDDGKRINAR